MPTSNPPDGSNHRRDERHEITFNAMLVIDKDVHATAIENISTGGAKLKTAAPVSVAKDTDCALRVDSLGEFPGQVAWCRGGSVGIAFNDSDWRMADAIMALAMHS